MLVICGHRHTSLVVIGKATYRPLQSANAGDFGTDYVQPAYMALYFIC
jgi:hypothetical protein